MRFGQNLFDTFHNTGRVGFFKNKLRAGSWAREDTITWGQQTVETVTSRLRVFLPVSGAVVVMADVSEVGREQPFCLWARNTSKLLYCCLQRPQMWMSGLTSTTIECPDERAGNPNHRSVISTGSS